MFIVFNVTVYCDEMIILALKYILVGNWGLAQ